MWIAILAERKYGTNLIKLLIDIVNKYLKWKGLGIKIEALSETFFASLTPLLCFHAREAVIIVVVITQLVKFH